MQTHIVPGIQRCHGSLLPLWIWTKIVTLTCSFNIFSRTGYAVTLQQTRNTDWIQFSAYVNFYSSMISVYLSQLGQQRTAANMRWNAETKKNFYQYLKDAAPCSSCSFRAPVITSSSKHYWSWAEVWHMTEKPSTMAEGRQPSSVPVSLYFSSDSKGQLRIHLGGSSAGIKPAMMTKWPGNGCG